MGIYSCDVLQQDGAAGSATSKSSSHIAKRFVVVLAMCTTVLVSLAATPSVSAARPTSNLLHSASLKEEFMQHEHIQTMSYGEEVWEETTVNECPHAPFLYARFYGSSRAQENQSSVYLIFVPFTRNIALDLLAHYLTSGVSSSSVNQSSGYSPSYIEPYQTLHNSINIIIDIINELQPNQSCSSQLAAYIPGVSAEEYIDQFLSDKLGRVNLQQCNKTGLRCVSMSCLSSRYRMQY